MLDHFTPSLWLYVVTQPKFLQLENEKIDNSQLCIICCEFFWKISQEFNAPTHKAFKVFNGNFI